MDELLMVLLAVVGGVAITLFLVYAALWLLTTLAMTDERWIDVLKWHPWDTILFVIIPSLIIIALWVLWIWFLSQHITIGFN